MQRSGLAWNPINQTFFAELSEAALNSAITHKSGLLHYFSIRRGKCIEPTEYHNESEYFTLPP
jgi:hypothetical protein